MSPVSVGVINVKPPALYCARPCWDRVYLTNAIAALVGLPMIVMSITCGEPFLTVGDPPAGVIVTDAVWYSAASDWSPRLIVVGSGMYDRPSSTAWVTNALAASS